MKYLQAPGIVGALLIALGVLSPISFPGQVLVGTIGGLLVGRWIGKLFP